MNKKGGEIVGLSDEEFSRQFYAAATLLQKIQLAIRENRYTIWVRSSPPNFPDEYLGPVLALPASTPVTRKEPRKSGGPGLNYVVELKYEYREMGKPITVYLKGFFSQKPDGRPVIGIEIQSLKDDSE